jgi:UDP-N-acetylmuramate dehydrogenase
MLGATMPRSLLTAQQLATLRAELPNSTVLADEPLSRHTSFCIGGPADVLVMPGETPDLARAVVRAREWELPCFILGTGSNLLVRDGGLRGIVVKLLDRFHRAEVRGNQIWSQSGALLGAVSRLAAEHSLTGLEFAVGIPGTMGGAIWMNAGAYGGEMKDVVTSVTLLDPDGAVRTHPADTMEFAYRASRLQRGGGIVAEVVMRLAELTEARESKQPLEFPSAGSIFKRPPGRFVGPMVEELGLKGFRIGGAEVSPKHAGFIVNAGGATAADVMAVMDYVRARVRERFDVELEPEVRVVGEP